MLGAGALGRPRGMVWGGRREEGSGWGNTCMPVVGHFDIWQNQYNIVKFKNKIKFKKKKKKNTFESVLMRWMKRVPIIQSEVSQKEKHRYSILTHIYGI